MQEPICKLVWLLAAGLLLSAPASAWDKLGHATVARIAEQRLTPAATRAVQRLLGGQSLTDIASWADDYRDAQGHSETAHWHYINMDVRQPLAAGDWLKFCQPESCVVAEIEADLALLSDRAHRSTAQQRTALKFLVHFVGDMHQPLHVADAGDRGASTKRVLLAGVQPDQQPKSLHSLWNGPEYFEGVTDAVTLGDRLDARIAPADVARWDQGGPADWAFEAYGIGKQQIYPDYQQALKRGEQAELSADYIQRMRPLVERQLQRAGVRLAWLLNTVFAE